MSRRCFQIILAFLTHQASFMGCLFSRWDNFSFISGTLRVRGLVGPLPVNSLLCPEWNNFYKFCSSSKLFRWGLLIIIVWFEYYINQWHRSAKIKRIVSITPKSILQDDQNRQIISKNYFKLVVGQVLLKKKPEKQIWKILPRFLSKCL